MEAGMGGVGAAIVMIGGLPIVAIIAYGRMYVTEQQDIHIDVNLERRNYFFYVE